MASRPPTKASPKKKKIEWKDSEEKEALRKALASGEVSTDPRANTPKEVYRPEFDFDGSYKKFGPRLRSLQATVGKGQRLASEDLALLLSDKEEAAAVGSNGKPRWDGSPAEMFMRVAVADGVATATKPAALKATKPAYSHFDGKTFRDHIYQKRKTQKWVKHQHPKAFEKMIGEAQAYTANYESEDEEE